MLPPLAPPPGAPPGRERSRSPSPPRGRGGRFGDKKFARYYRDPSKEAGGITAAARSGFVDSGASVDALRTAPHVGSGSGNSGGAAYAKEAAAADPLRAMEFFAKQAAREDKFREERQAAAKEKTLASGGFSSERLTPAEIAAAATGARGPIRREDIDARIRYDGTRGHHMGDFAPPGAFIAPADAAAAAARDIAARIGSGGGHAVETAPGTTTVQKTWAKPSGAGAGGETPGLGHGGGGGGLGYGGGADNPGLGSDVADPAAPKEGEDIFEQYKKRMMQGYRHRPNPLGNPRKQYY
jgi:splicing factor 4